MIFRRDFQNGRSIFRSQAAASRAFPSFIAFVGFALLGLAISHVFTERGMIMAEARKDTANLASSLLQHAELTVRTADALLIGLVDRLEHESPGPEQLERLRGWLVKEVRQSTQFVSFAVIDSEGKMVLTSAGEGGAKDGVAKRVEDRDYFIYHQTHTDRELQIGAPVRGRAVGQWLIPVTRRFNRADGSFGGVAIAAIDPRYFQDFYERLDIGKNGVVLLASPDGRLLVRRPFIEANIGRDMRNRGTFEQLKLSPVGSLEMASATDGVVRFTSYEQGYSYPLVVAVAKDMNELLGPWRENSIRRAIEAVSIVLVVSLLGVVVWRATTSLGVNTAQLTETNERFDAALSHLPSGLSMFDADGKLMVWNDRYVEMYGMSGELIRHGVDIRAIVEHRSRVGNLDADVDAYIGSFRQALIDEGRSTTTSRLKDGHVIEVENTAIAGGGWVAIHEDITERIHNENEIFRQTTELARTNMRFDAALSNMSQGISMFDGEKRLVVWNERYAALYDYAPDVLKVGVHVNALAEHRVTCGILGGATDPAAVEGKIASMNQLETDSSRVEELSDGRLIQITRQPTADGGWVATHEDITERRRAEAAIVHVARHDMLTGLANRMEFNARLEDALKRLKRSGGTVTVMMLDLDKFKAVNDTLGHHAGDLLLKQVAERLRSSIRETDVVARLGGDEFAIIQQGESGQHEGAIALALRIIGAITTPFDLDGHHANIGTSIGIAFAPEHGNDPEELMKRADLALYEVKARGRNDFRIFRREMLDVVDLQLSAEGALRDAIARGEFELHYQPVVDVDARIRGVEALIRWRHPARGLLTPDQFIPLAESTGLIVPIGEWLLQQACADAAKMPSDLRIAVNVSAVQFKQGKLFDVILCTLVETGLKPERLELEITESALVGDRDEHLMTIRQLKNLGISMTLDDFGTGYSSMSYLTVFPFDKIKIDKSFTQNAHERRDCKAVIAAAIVLARGLGIATTAEGVETEDQFKYLREAGVDLVQGGLFGQPAPASQLDLRNANWPKPKAARDDDASSRTFHHPIEQHAWNYKAV
jgi:diguanylate cyclase (GGDEF)-like protein/PAS domain S-box-containing protein